MTALASLLKKHRERKGLTQREVSEVLGFETPQFISNLERGTAILPPKHVRKVSKLLDIPIGTLCAKVWSAHKKVFFKEVFDERGNI